MLARLIFANCPSIVTIAVLPSIMKINSCECRRISIILNNVKHSIFPVNTLSEWLFIQIFLLCDFLRVAWDVSLVGTAWLKVAIFAETENRFYKSTKIICYLKLITSEDTTTV